MIVCLQETIFQNEQLAKKYRVFCNPHKITKTCKGGITTLELEHIGVDTNIQGKFHLTVGLKLKEHERLPIVNLYLPLASCQTVKMERDMQEEVHDSQGDTPINDFIVVVGNFNAHIGGNTVTANQTCTCKECEHTTLAGQTDKRGY